MPEAGSETEPLRGRALAGRFLGHSGCHAERGLAAPLPREDRVPIELDDRRAQDGSQFVFILIAAVAAETD